MVAIGSGTTAYPENGHAPWHKKIPSLGVESMDIGFLEVTKHVLVIGAALAKDIAVHDYCDTKPYRPLGMDGCWGVQREIRGPIGGGRMIR